MSQISERILVQAHLAAKQVPPLSPAEEADYKARIGAALKARDAVLVAHYYTDPVLQALAEETGGCVSDSLEMARFGKEHPAKTLVVAGVRFMGETSQILSPEQRVLMPTLEATQTLPNDTFIVATDRGIFYKMQQGAPGKLLIEAPTAGSGATCRSCAHCPWMAMNTLPALLQSLEQGSNEIHVPAELIPQAVKPLERMLTFTRNAKLNAVGNA